MPGLGYFYAIWPENGLGPIFTEQIAGPQQSIYLTISSFAIV